MKKIYQECIKLTIKLIKNTEMPKNIAPDLTEELDDKQVSDQASEAES